MGMHVRGQSMFEMQRNQIKGFQRHNVNKVESAIDEDDFQDELIDEDQIVDDEQYYRDD